MGWPGTPREATVATPVGTPRHAQDYTWLPRGVKVRLGAMLTRLRVVSGEINRAGRILVWLDSEEHSDGGLYVETTKTHAREMVEELQQTDTTEIEIAVDGGKLHKDDGKLHGADLMLGGPRGPAVPAEGPIARAGEPADDEGSAVFEDGTHGRARGYYIADDDGMIHGPFVSEQAAESYFDEDDDEEEEEED